MTDRGPEEVGVAVFLALLAVATRERTGRPTRARALGSKAANAHPFGKLSNSVAAMRGPVPRWNSISSLMIAGAGRLRVVIINGPLTSGA